MSLALLPDRSRLVATAAHGRAQAEGFLALPNSDSVAYRHSVRGPLIELAADGRLAVPVARTYPLAQAADALAFLGQRHPGGKLALIP